MFDDPTTAPGEAGGDAVLSGEELERALVEAATVVHAAEARFARLLARFAASGRVGASGSRSLAHWVSWRCGFAVADARRRAVLAERLVELPALGAAMERGQVGVSVAAGVAAVATPATEERLVEVAASATPAHVARVVGSYRRARAVEEVVDAGGVVVEDAEGRPERRWARWHVAEDGTFGLHAELPAVEGALVARAFEAAGDRLRRAGRPSPAGAVAEVGGADALVELARHLLGCDREVAGPVADRYVVQVHVDLDALADPDGDRSGVLDDGIPVEPAAVRGLLCIAAVQGVVERDGQVLQVGRRSRFATARQRPALARRDGGACSRGARCRPGGARPTTRRCPGAGAGGRIWTTWSWCAGPTTTWCTTGGGRWSGPALRGGGGSAGPTAGCCPGTWTIRRPRGACRCPATWVRVPPPRGPVSASTSAPSTTSWPTSSASMPTPSPAPPPPAWRPGPELPTSPAPELGRRRPARATRPSPADHAGGLATRVTSAADAVGAGPSRLRRNPASLASGLLAPRRRRAGDAAGGRPADVRPVLPQSSKTMTLRATSPVFRSS